MRDVPAANLNNRIAARSEKVFAIDCAERCLFQLSGVWKLTKESVNAEMKKGHVINDMALNSGGTDGTRTRDPLRDRQVF